MSQTSNGGGNGKPSQSNVRMSKDTQEKLLSFFRMIDTVTPLHVTSEKKMHDAVWVIPDPDGHPGQRLVLMTPETEFDKLALHALKQAQQELFEQLQNEGML